MMPQGIQTSTLSNMFFPHRPELVNKAFRRNAVMCLSKYFLSEVFFLVPPNSHPNNNF